MGRYAAQVPTTNSNVIVQITFWAQTQYLDLKITFVKKKKQKVRKQKC